MNSIFIAIFLCMGALVSGNPLLLDDGQWRGEGLVESQDWSQWSSDLSAAWEELPPGVWAARAAPLGTWGLGGATVFDGHAINPAEVAVSRANLIAANVGASTSPLGWATPYNSWASPLNSWAHGGAPIGLDGRVVDTPEVAITKAAHLNAKIAAVSHL